MRAATVCLYVRPYVCPYVCLSVCLSVSLSACLSVCPHECYLNASIRFSIFATSAHASHPYSMLESTRDQNSLCLGGKSMLLLNTRLSFEITSVTVAILMQISALQVPFLDKVPPT